MSKYTILDHIGMCVPKSKVRRMCQEMELTEEETRLMLTRYCDRVRAEVIEFMSMETQRTVSASMEAKCLSFLQDHLGFFNFGELCSIIKRYTSK